MRSSELMPKVKGASDMWRISPSAVRRSTDCRDPLPPMKSIIRRFGLYLADEW